MTPYHYRLGFFLGALAVVVMTIDVTIGFPCLVVAYAVTDVVVSE